MPLITIRGVTQVVWVPNYTLTLTSPDGLELEADGEEHTIIATLLNTATGAAVPNRTIRLLTTPSARVGNGKRARTDIEGKARFVVSNEDDESIDYEAQLAPQFAVTGDLTIQWGEAGQLVGVDWTIDSNTAPPGPPYQVNVPVPVFVSVVTSPGGVPVVGVTVTMQSSLSGATFDCGPTDGSGIASGSFVESINGQALYTPSAITGGNTWDGAASALDLIWVGA